MIEKPPKINKKISTSTIHILANPKHIPLLKKINNEYLYWDKVKHITPSEISPKNLWEAVKIQRLLNIKTIHLGNYSFYFNITEKMQEQLHFLDMNLGGNLGTKSILSSQDKNTYLVSSIMEEAIASSQMEGASTTRKVAKDMLRKQLKPKNKGQEMIFNNYITIKYLVENKTEGFSIEKLKTIHQFISSNTLDNAKDEGNIRTSDNVMVLDNITGSIAHIPPSYKDINLLLEELCNFANKNEENNFIHPIIKGIIIHFLLSYIHPFVDGNGRTARSLVYWYMLKQGYWLTEYLSISRIIYRSKTKYERAFLHTENDDNDLSYFILFNLEAMVKAYYELSNYLQRKITEQDNILQFKAIEDINERQAQILKILSDKPKHIFTAKELVTRFNISIKTSRSDLQELVTMGYLEKINLNKRLIGYIRSKDFAQKLPIKA